MVLPNHARPRAAGAVGGLAVFGCMRLAAFGDVGRVGGRRQAKGETNAGVNRMIN